MGASMSKDEILRAHNKELFEHRTKQLAELLDVPEEYAAHWIVCDMVMKYMGITFDDEE
jgi:peroxiredoxin family protein